MTRIEVTTGARLHFGLLCGKPDSAWHYGGVGMMIDSPAWQLQIAAAKDTSEDAIVASLPAADRIAQLLKDFRKRHHNVGPVCCTVIKEMEFHSGLGSGTQLTLAVASALLILTGEARPEDITMVAQDFGRSQRSAIGTFGFDRGGFIIDHGKNCTNHAARQRMRFPETWRIVLITPGSHQGLSGQQEESFFGARDFLDEATLHAIAAVIDSGIRPALKHEDYPLFSKSLAQYGQLIGEYYASEQGGIFSSPLIRDLATWLESENLPLPVQSSWGPTVCIPAASTTQAEAITQAISNRLAEDDAVKFTIARGLNTGATIKTIAPENQRSFG